MLTITKTINITGVTTIDGVVAERYSASINSADPSGMSLNLGIRANADLVEANLEECRANRTEFEDAAYEVKNKLLAELESDSTDDTETEES